MVRKRDNILFDGLLNSSTDFSYTHFVVVVVVVFACLTKTHIFLIIRKLKERVNYCSDKGTELAQIQLNRSEVLSGRSAI